MNPTKLAIIIPAVALTTFVTATPAHAFWPFDLFNNNASTSTQTTDSTPSLLDTIIQKFNLNKDQVNQVVTDYQTERQNQRETQYKQNLDQAVKDGKITQAQEQLILDEHNKLVEQQQTEEQNRQQNRQQLQDWANQNGIDVRYLGVGYGRGGHGMMHDGDEMGMVRGQW